MARFRQQVADADFSFLTDFIERESDIYSAAHHVVYRVKDYGITVPFKYMHLFEYLRNCLRDHKGSITKLGRKVAYQRPCASRASMTLRTADADGLDGRAGEIGP